MNVSLSDLKVNVGRYVDLAETEDVVITKSGGNETEFVNLNKSYEQCRKLLQQKISEMKSNQEG